MTINFTELQVVEGTTATITGTVPSSYAGTYVFWKVFTTSTFPTEGMVLVPAPGSSGDPPVINQYSSISFNVTVPYTDADGSILSVGLSTTPSGITGGTSLGNATAIIIQTASNNTLTANKASISPGEEINLTIFLSKTSLSSVYLEFEGAEGLNLTYFYEVTPYAVKAITSNTLQVKISSDVGSVITLKSKFFSTTSQKFRFKIKSSPTATDFLAATSDLNWNPIQDLVFTATLDASKDLSIGETIGISLHLENFEAYKSLHPDLYPSSSINTFKFIVGISGSISVNSSHFSMTNYPMFVQDQEIVFSADGTKNISLVLDNLKNLSKASAPYPFSVYVKVKWPSTSIPSTLVSQQSYNIPSSEFPNPFAINFEFDSTDLYIEQPFRVRLHGVNLSSNLQFEGNTDKKVGFYIKGLEPDSIIRFNLGGEDGITRALKRLSLVPGFNFVDYWTDPDGNTVVIYSLRNSDDLVLDLELMVSKRNWSYLNSNGLGGEEDSDTWLEKLFKAYLPVPRFKIFIVELDVKVNMSNPRHPEYDITVGRFLGSSEFISVRMPKVNFLPSYSENEHLSTTITNLNGYEGLDLYWKALLVKGTTVLRTLELGNSTIINGSIPIEFDIPAVLDETQGIKIITNGVSNFEFLRQPAISSTYNYILNKADDTSITLDKSEIQQGDTIILSISSHNLGTKLLSIGVQGLSLSDFSRQVGLDLKPLESNNTIDNFTGDTSITLKLTSASSKAYGVPFRFVISANLGGVISVIGYSPGCILPIPTPISCSISTSTPTPGELHIGETLDLGILFSNVSDNLILKNLTNFSAIVSLYLNSNPILYNLQLDYSDSSGKSVTYPLSILVDKTNVAFSFKIKLKDLEKIQYDACPAALVVQVSVGLFGQFTNGTTIIPKPAIPALSFKTLIYNRSKNNKTYSFSESNPRQSTIYYERILNPKESFLVPCRNASLNPVPSTTQSPVISDVSLTSQQKFNPSKSNTLDKCSFRLSKYSPYVMLNVTNVLALDGNYIIALDSDYINQNNIIFNTMTKSSNYNHTPDYRCLYLKNTHPADMALQVGIYIAEQPSAKDVLEIGLDPAGKNADAQVIANAFAAPNGVTFSKATYDSPVVVGTLMPGESIAFWIKRYSTSETEAPAVIDISRIAYKALV